MLRSTVVVLALWTLFLVPILCLGGMLIHACACSTEESCAHEDHCATDPCADSVRPSTGTPEVAAYAQNAVAIVPAFSFEAPSGAILIAARGGLVGLKSRHSAGTFPLLI